MLPDNIGYLFDSALQLRPTSPAIFQENVAITFETLDARCNQVANGLRRLGVRAGMRIALMFDNNYKFLEALFGTMRLGAVAVPLNTRMADEGLGYVLADSESYVLIASRAMATRASILSRSVETIKHVVVDENIEGLISYEPFMEASSKHLGRRETNPDEICMQPYTSGSTGKPKGVLLTHGGQAWNADVVRKAYMLDESDRALVAVPLFHKNAMIGAVKPFLLAGGSLVIMFGFTPVEMISAIERFRVTYLTGVPAMYKMLLAQRAVLAKHDLTSLRFAVCGSAEVPVELLQEFADVFKAPMAESYGLTEGGPVPLINTCWGLKKRGSCGRAIPGCDVRLVSEDGIADVKVDEIGELVTRNPGLAKGYWKLPSVTAQKFRDGWLHTGDLMRRDHDGYWYFVGRKDDAINVAGEKVHPKEVEDILLRHPNIQDVCVVGAPHEAKGEVPVAFVSERLSGQTTEEEVTSFFLKHGAAYAHPRRVFFLNFLPLSSTGKLDRAALREKARKNGVIPQRVKS